MKSLDEHITNTNQFELLPSSTIQDEDIRSSIGDLDKLRGLYSLKGAKKTICWERLEGSEAREPPDRCERGTSFQRSVLAFYIHEHCFQLLDYLEEAPSPLGSKPFPYNEKTIRNLLEKLRPYNLTKAEFLMIMNLRPSKPENLNTIIEQMEDRFPQEETQYEIVRIIGEVLGRPDGEAERNAMTQNAKEARKVEEEAERGAESMVMDD